jgi:hypothetical protein
MNRHEYWELVQNKLDDLIKDFYIRYNESINPEYLHLTVLSEISKLWEFSNFILGYNGSRAIYDGGEYRYTYLDLLDGKRDYNSLKHLELDAYLCFEKCLKEEKINIPIENSYFDIKNTLIEKSYNVSKLKDFLISEDLEKFFSILTSYFASIPYDIYKDKTKESYFHVIFHSCILSTGLKVYSEVVTNIGRIDTVIELDKLIYIFELKTTLSSSDALKQIKEKKYYQKYLNEFKKIYLVGIKFDLKERNIGDWKFEIIHNEL